ncbi:MAG: DUF503 domain-containing protein [Lentisphaeria bacterium]|nr:DUF503 domain-containing protein [Lentisphaeria bacterium]
MVIGIIHLDLAIEHAMSLKDKRAVLNRIKDRVRQKFNVSIAEVADQDIWNVASLGVVMVSNNQKYCNEVLDQVLNHVRKIGNCEIQDWEFEYIVADD